MSFGSTGFEQAFEDALIEAQQIGRGGRGIVCCASSGNDGSFNNIQYPAYYSGVCSIGALEFNSFDYDYQINNLYRSNTVGIITKVDLPNPMQTDYSRFTGIQVSPTATNIEDVTNTAVDSTNGNLFNTPPTCSSHYGALKVRRILPHRLDQVSSYQFPTT
jgi:hypothetical protein